MREQIIVRNEDLTIKNQLLSKLKELRPSIIGIDGEDGVGKSTKIAPFLSEQLGGAIISLDNYLVKNKGGYVEYLKYEALRNDLLNLLEKSQPIIIEGLMFLDVAKKIGIQQDYLIYACCDLWFYHWTEEDGNYNNHGTLEEIIGQEENKVGIIAKVLTPKEPYHMEGMRRELFAYTYGWRPLLKAEAVWIA